MWQVHTIEGAKRDRDLTRERVGCRPLARSYSCSRQPIKKLSSGISVNAELGIVGLVKLRTRIESLYHR